MPSQNSLEPAGCFSWIALAKPRYSRLHLQVGVVVRSKLHGVIQETRGLFELIFRYRKIAQLPQTQRDGLTIAAFCVDGVAGGQ